MKKRKLFAPGKLPIRPTPDRVREALFSSLGSKVFESVFLDLFSGTGAVGIEAVSRGASYVKFVEKDAAASTLIQRNLTLCNISNTKTAVLKQDAVSCMGSFFLKKEGFDIIFMDPPYHTALTDQLIKVLDNSSVLKPSGVFVVEHYFKKEVPPETSLFTRSRQKKYGETVLSYYTYKETQQEKSQWPEK